MTMIKIDIFNNHLAYPVVGFAALAVACHALLQSQWSLAVLMLLIAPGYRSIIGILELSKVKKERLVLAVQGDASVQLMSGDEVLLQGFLDRQHWCSNHVVVLNVDVGGKTRHFTALSVQQENKDNFRRLKTRLRYSFYPCAQG